MMGAAPIVLNIQATPGHNHTSRKGFITTIDRSNFRPGHTNILLTRKCRPISTISSVDEISAAITSDPVQAEVTWEIVLGTIAGVTPFVVAGIEFSKRIVAQRQCKVCKGSGLVLRDKKYYFRCPRCGGFLPWQSWRRFFTG